MSQKHMKKWISGIIVVLLIMMVPIMAFAAEWNVGDWSEFTSVFANDTDEEVIINLLGDIFGGGSVVSTGAGQSYTVNGDGFALEGAGFGGEGTVVLEDTKLHETYADGDVHLTQNGDVTGGLYAYGNAGVTVNGDVTNENGVGVEAGGEAKVNVSGDVSSSEGGEGVYAGGKAEVHVGGDVTGGDSEYDGGTAVYAADEAVVCVEGDASGGDGQYTGGDGVYASEKANVTVGGNAAGGDSEHNAGKGVTAKGESTVTVEGNVAGGDLQPAADPQASAYIDPGIGIDMDNTATVQVKGNVTGGKNHSADGVAGAGLRIWVLPLETDQTLGSVTVNGTVSGGADESGNGKDGNAIYYNVLYTPDAIALSDLYTMEDKFADIYWELEMYTAQEWVVLEQASNLSYAMWNDINLIIDGAEPEELTPAQLAQIHELLQTTLDEIYGLLVPTGLVYEVPEITVQKLKNLGEYFGAGTDIGGAPASSTQTLADLLGADVNYFVTIPTVPGGTVTADKPTAKAGETVTFTAHPDEGMSIDHITVNDRVLSKNADGTFTYVMDLGGADILDGFDPVDNGQEPPKPDEPKDDTNTPDGVPKTDGTPATGDRAVGIRAYVCIGVAGMLAMVMLCVAHRRRQANGN